MKQFIFILLFVVSLTACSENKKNNDALFKREIPLSNGRPDIFYKTTQQIVKQLHLDSLQNGCDSIEMRILCDYGYTTRDLIVIKRTKYNWSATVYTMNAHWDNSSFSEKIFNEKKMTLIPKSGWDDFVKKLFALKIMTLKNMYDIPELKNCLGSDGSTFCVEIATKKEYRFYWYWEPEQFQDKSWQAKNMTDILNLIRVEFNNPYN